MSRCTERNLNFLKHLAKSKKNDRVKLLRCCTNDNIKAVSEIALNTLKGNLNLKNKEREKGETHFKRENNVFSWSLHLEQRGRHKSLEVRFFNYT
jgi:hypothetical protein